MTPLNLVLWLAGLALICVGYSQLRGPYQRYRQLRATDENVRRYEDWRGGRRTASDEGTGVTGADVMRDMLRGRMRIWSLVIAAGVVLVFFGFALR